MSSSLKEKIIKSLEMYNKSKLKNNVPGEYYYKGKVLPKYHILPVSMADKNIIAPYDSDLRTSDYIKRHRYFHHLNSSQAMCINFFYPLIKEKQLELVLRAIYMSISKLKKYYEQEFQSKYFYNMTCANQ